MKSGDMMYNEYKFLRDEVVNYGNTQVSLTTFTITATAGIITLGVNNKNPYIFLLSFIIIVPLFYRILFYRSASMRLAAYLIVFLEPKIEGINWETINSETITSIWENDKAIIKFSKIIRHNEFTILAIISDILFLYFYLQQENTTLVFYFALLSSLVLTATIAYSTYKGNMTAKMKEHYIKEWSEIKECRKL